MENQFSELSEKEYLLTNGIGGYCSSTFSGANTRRYHGLLVAAFNPPTDRMVLVSKIEETVIIDGNSIELSANQYPEAIHPQGFQWVQTYAVENNKAIINFKGAQLQLQKVISMVSGENTTTVQYTNHSSQKIELQLNPLLVYKDYHGLFKQEPQFDFYTEALEYQALKVYAKYQAHPLIFKISSGNWTLKPVWYKNFQHTIEKERGFDFEEDAMSIGTVNVLLAEGDSCTISFSSPGEAALPMKPKYEALYTANKNYPNFIKDLELSSRDFVVHRKSTEGSTILAGYHWFTDWGRDTMIALRGISIATFRKDEAKSILQTFFNYLDAGMLPNRFPDYEEALEYNTIDATLWLFVALYEYQLTFNDPEFIKEVLPSLKSILDAHIKGTRYDIHVTEEGLLYGGIEGVQLTWMDAKVEGYVVTPRIGCAVEINLLWYNALHIYQHFNTVLYNKTDKAIMTQLAAFKKEFVKNFLNESGYLNDVVLPGGLSDASLRPNQIYAVSLPFSPLSAKQQKSILEIIQKELLTDYGLRTLAQHHIDFKPVYTGNAWNRDTAYHQGTVWPFLWGEWAIGYLQLNGYSPSNCHIIWEASKKLQHHFYNQGCIKGIAEIFDGLTPEKGKGCTQQAWSVSMILRVFLDQQFDFSLIN